MNQLTPDEQAALLVAALKTAETDLKAGAVVTIVRGRVRARRLPFGR